MDLTPYERPFVIHIVGPTCTGKTLHGERLLDIFNYFDIPVLVNPEPTNSIFGKGIRMIIESVDTLPDKSFLKEQYIPRIFEYGNEITKKYSPHDSLIREYTKELRTASWNLCHRKKLTEFQKQCLFIADRDDNIENVIIPAMRAGKHIFNLRGFICCVVYGGACAVPYEKLFILNRKVLGERYDLVKPHLVLHINITSETAMYRLEKSSKQKDCYETKEITSRVIDMYGRVLSFLHTVDPYKMGGPKIISVSGEGSKERSFEFIYNEIIAERSRIKTQI